MDKGGGGVGEGRGRGSPHTTTSFYSAKLCDTILCKMLFYPVLNELYYFDSGIIEDFQDIYHFCNTEKSLQTGL